MDGKVTWPALRAVILQIYGTTRIQVFQKGNCEMQVRERWGKTSLMAKRVQQEFLGNGFKKPGRSFGGSLLKGNPKTKRPLESKLPILVTLRANKSVMRLPKTYGNVQRLVTTIAKKHGIRVYSWVNVGNHIHLVVRVARRGLWAPFIRELTGRIAQVTKDTLKLKDKFWKYRPHTLIVGGWGKAYKNVRNYIYLNRLEAEGCIDRGGTRTLKDLQRLLGLSRSPG